MDEPQINAALALAYDAALDPSAWPALLACLAGLFRSHFADVFARSQDFQRYGGMVFGLDQSDYQGQLLDGWVKRNVWSQSHPTRLEGEVVSTRQMVAKPDLLKSDMYNEYLAPRGLHEGLRLAISVSNGWIQDISLLRPWSAGPFTTEEHRVAGVILPHLQRASLVSRRLQEADTMARAGAATLDMLQQAWLVLDATGRVLRTNAAADRLLAQGDGLVTAAGGLAALDVAGSRALQQAIRRAAGDAGDQALSGTVRLSRPSGGAALTLTILPLGAEKDWLMIQSPAVLVLASDRSVADPGTADHLATLFGLTGAEAELATALLTGHSIKDVALASGRSVHTVRTHLSHLMTKTQTSRQSTLMRELMMAVQTRSYPIPAPLR